MSDIAYTYLRCIYGGDSLPYGYIDGFLLREKNYMDLLLPLIICDTLAEQPILLVIFELKVRRKK